MRFCNCHCRTNILPRNFINKSRRLEISDFANGPYKRGIDLKGVELRLWQMIHEHVMQRDLVFFLSDSFVYFNCPSSKQDFQRVNILTKRFSISRWMISIESMGKVHECFEVSLPPQDFAGQSRSKIRWCKSCQEMKWCDSCTLMSKSVIDFMYYYCPTLALLKSRCCMHC